MSPRRKPKQNCLNELFMNVNENEGAERVIEEDVTEEVGWEAYAIVEEVECEVLSEQDAQVYCEN